MRKELRQQLLQEFEDQIFREIFKALHPDMEPRHEKALRKMWRRTALQYKKIAKELRTVPDDKYEEYRKKLEEIGKLVSYAFRSKMTEAVKRLPRDPGGAHPKLTLEQQVEACALIGGLIMQGEEPKDALNHAARRFKVSVRTMQRVWKKRRELLAH